MFVRSHFIWNIHFGNTVQWNWFVCFHSKCVLSHLCYHHPSFRWWWLKKSWFQLELDIIWTGTPLRTKKVEHVPTMYPTIRIGWLSTKSIWSKFKVDSIKLYITHNHHQPFALIYISNKIRNLALFLEITDNHSMPTLRRGSFSTTTTTTAQQIPRRHPRSSVQRT